MKLKCIDNSRSPSLTLDAVYCTVATSGLAVRVEADNGELLWFPAEYFEVQV